MISIRSALKDEPLNASLLSLIGLWNHEIGNETGAVAVMRLARKVARRDTISALYLIEFSSEMGDVQAALKNYNDLLLSRPQLYDSLLPILSSAIVYPEVRKALRPYLEKASRWTPAFLSIAARDANPKDVQAMLLPLPKQLLREEYTSSLAEVLQRLAQIDGVSSSTTFAKAIAPGFSARTFRDLRFTLETTDPRLGTLVWTLPKTEGFQTDIGLDGALRITAEPLARGRVAIRDIFFDKPGDYELQYVENQDDSPFNSKIKATWSSSCVISRRGIQILPLTSSEAGLTRSVRAILKVPDECSLVRFELLVDGPDGTVSSSILIDKINLFKI